MAKLVGRVFWKKKGNCCRHQMFWGKIRDERNLKLFLLKQFLCWLSNRTPSSENETKLIK